MPTTKQKSARKTAKSAPTKPVPVLFPPELLARADALRGEHIPRAAFLRDLVDKALTQLEDRS